MWEVVHTAQIRPVKWYACSNALQQQALPAVDLPTCLPCLPACADLGGGTFDVSLLTIEEGIFEVRAPFLSFPLLHLMRLRVRCVWR